MADRQVEIVETPASCAAGSTRSGLVDNNAK
jgi:hypothetical protein